LIPDTQDDPIARASVPMKLIYPRVWLMRKATWNTRRPYRA